MTNALNTHSILAAEAAAVLEEMCPFLMHVNRAREKEFQSAYNGYKVGDTISITVPGRSSVYTTSTLADGGSVEDFVEQTVTLTPNIHRHTAYAGSMTDEIFKLEARDPRRADWRKRVLRPQLSSLAASIEYALLDAAVKATPNLVGTPGTVPSAMTTYNQARGKLQNQLAPDTERYVVFSTDSNIALVDASKALFNPSEEISKQFRDSYIGRAARADWFESVNLPSITNGSDVTGCTISGASQDNVSAITVTGLSAAPAVGSVFTIAGVFDVHPLTGQAYSTLKQFVVLSGSTTTSINIYPALKSTFPNKTVSAAPADTAAITFVGSASTAYRQNLMWQRDAFTVAFVDVPIVAGTEGATVRTNGISVTAQTGGTFSTLASTTRLDVRFGITAVRGNHACRITE
jgi:hypothetical protein